MKELEFLKIIQSFSSVKGIGDDCALVSYDSDCSMLISTDMLVAGNHFEKSEKRLNLIGQKAISVNVSDIYSSGGKPSSVYISLALPREFLSNEIKLLYDGINEACSYFGIQVSGGDITSTDGPFVINVAVTGKVKKGKQITRKFAKPGDAVFVSGVLGKASSESYQLKDRYYRILPLDKIDYIISSEKVHAMTDISDGLARSLYDISVSSKVGFEINRKLIPISEGASFDNAFNGGEDYQVLFTVGYENVKYFSDRFTKIGVVTDQREDIVLVGANSSGKYIGSYGYDHFS